MDGRLQNEMRIEKANDKKASEMPVYVQNWYLNMKASRKTAATCRDYLTKAKNFLQYINHDVCRVSPSDITESTVTSYFLSIQRKEGPEGLQATSDSYQITVWCCLDSFLGYLSRNGLISQNYIRSIDKPKNRDLIRINENRVLLTADDFKLIVQTVHNEKNKFQRTRDEAIIILLMNTGMRETALTTLTMDNIDIDNRLLRVTDKGNKRHEYILNDAVIDAMTNWLSVRGETEDNHIFISRLSKKMSSNAVANLVRKYSEEALGEPISPHKLRSGYCSILYGKTHDIEFVRRCVGHANAATTQRYIVTKGEEKEKAAEIMGSIF